MIFSPTLAFSVSKSILLETVSLIKRVQLFMIASSLAYTTILSIIPLLAVSLAIFQAFGGLDKVYDTIEPLIVTHLAQSSGTEAMTYIRQFISKIHAGSLGAGGLLGLLFTSLSMLFSAEKAINQVWSQPLTRSLFQRVTAYWFMMTIGPLTLAVVLGFATSSSIPLSKFVPQGAPFFLVLMCFFSAIFKFIPHRLVSNKAALIAGIMTAILFHLAETGYAYYVKRALSYSKIYGSLAAFPVFLVWIYVMWLVVLIGAALSASIHHALEAEGKKL